jgi:ADP-ribosyl-[dinitrogen reductase] hydrolase
LARSAGVVGRAEGKYCVNTIAEHRAEPFAGILLGCAVGDALGLPAEGLSPARIQRQWHGIWRHRLLPGRGMVSDDTEHTVMVAQALLASRMDAAVFQRELACRLRWWFARLPAGVGLATARACIKLWLGFPPDRSGVFSAGNGPAMRSAVIGTFFAEDANRRREFVRISTRITHTDSRAEVAALAVAETTALAVRGESAPGAVLARLSSLSNDAEWQPLVQRIGLELEAGTSVADFARRLGLERGISGYAYHTVPVALFAWLRHGRDFEGALTAALNCGGDTDTVGAILGGICGAAAGEAAIPSAWLDGLRDWPCTTRFLRHLAQALADAAEGRPVATVPSLSAPAMLLRNIFFLAVVLGHGFWRLTGR